ncbi:MAG: PqiC family protein [Pseudomonadota bacterium]
MTSRLSLYVVGVCIALFLGACGSSPPTHYYRLTAMNNSIGSQQQPAIGVGPVEIPQFLQRNAIVYSRGANQLEVAGTELWAEPLADGAERVLGLNLAKLLDTQNLTFFPWDSKTQPDVAVKVRILDLDADAATAVLSAEWLVYYPADGEVIDRQISTLTRSISGSAVSAAVLPEAYSALLFSLAETIADAIKQHQLRSPASISPPLSD